MSGGIQCCLVPWRHNQQISQHAAKNYFVQVYATNELRITFVICFVFFLYVFLCLVDETYILNYNKIAII